MFFFLFFLRNCRLYRQISVPLNSFSFRWCGCCYIYVSLSLCVFLWSFFSCLIGEAAQPKCYIWLMIERKKTREVYEWRHYHMYCSMRECWLLSWLMCIVEYTIEFAFWMGRCKWHQKQNNNEKKQIITKTETEKQKRSSNITSENHHQRQIGLIMHAVHIYSFCLCMSVCVCVLWLDISFTFIIT